MHFIYVFMTGFVLKKKKRKKKAIIKNKTKKINTHIQTKQTKTKKQTSNLIASDNTLADITLSLQIPPPPPPPPPLIPRSFHHPSSLWDGGQTNYMPISTEGSGTPTTRPKTGSQVYGLRWNFRIYQCKVKYMLRSKGHNSFFVQRTWVLYTKH